MSKYHVEAIFKQFPWLKNHFPDGEKFFVHARVEKFSAEFLACDAGYWDTAYFDSGQVKTYLFSQDGTHLGNVHPGRPLISYFKKGSWMRRVDDTLALLGSKLTDVSYAVEVRGQYLTIYTPLKDFTPAALLASEVQRREDQRRHAAAEIAKRI